MLLFVALEGCGHPWACRRADHEARGLPGRDALRPRPRGDLVRRSAAHPTPDSQPCSLNLPRSIAGSPTWKDQHDGWRRHSNLASRRLRVGLSRLRLRSQPGRVVTRAAPNLTVLAECGAIPRRAAHCPGTRSARVWSIRPHPDRLRQARHRLRPQRFIQHVGHDRAVVVGHDRGARVAHRWALDQPSEVAALVLLDILPTWVAMNSMTASRRQRIGTGFSISSPTFQNYL